MKFLTPIIILGIACGLFFGVAKPMYAKVQEIKASIAEKQTVLDNAEKLKQKSANLTSSYNQFSESDKEHLESLLPDDVESMKLVLAIHNISKSYNMLLKGTKFDTNKRPTNSSVAGNSVSNASYNTFDMEFTLIGKYPDFVSFMRDLEKSLRIVDAAEVTFSTVDSSGNETSGASPALTKEILKFDVKIKTYWLK